MPKDITILYIEDDQDDVELLEESLIKHNILYRMNVLKDGQQAINYLTACTSYPDIVVLDLNLPKVHGRDVLKYIKSNAEMKNLPVLILTTSNNEFDIAESYKNGASKYLEKPSTVQAIKITVETIVNLVSLNGSNTDSN